MANFFLEIIYSLSNGIPGIFIAAASVAIVVLGLIREHSGMVLAGGLLMIPVAFVSGGWTGLLLAVRLLPLLVFLAAYLVSVEEMLVAWVAVIPPIVFVGVYVFTILYDNVKSLNLF